MLSLALLSLGALIVTITLRSRNQSDLSRRTVVSHPPSSTIPISAPRATAAESTPMASPVRALSLSTPTELGSKPLPIPAAQTEMPSYLLRTGDKSFKLYFEDGDVAPSLIKLIVDDLNLTFAHLKRFRILPPVESTRKFTIGKHPYKTVGLVDFEEQSQRFFPRVIGRSIGDMVEVNGDQGIVVPEEVVTSYRSIVKLVEAMPRAFETIDAFIERINHLAESPPSTVDEILTAGLVKNDRDKILSQWTPALIVKSLGSRKYRKSSLLQVERFAKDGEDVLLAPLYVYEAGVLTDHAPPMVYEHGKWKLMLGLN